MTASYQEAEHSGGQATWWRRGGVVPRLALDALARDAHRVVHEPPLSARPLSSAHRASRAWNTQL